MVDRVSDIGTQDVSKEEVKIPLRFAKIICEMDEVCWSEGIGPDSKELIHWLLDEYPELVGRFKRYGHSV